MRGLLVLISLLLLTACAPKTGQDPLKHTKKLIIKGHGSLYENGMLEIPFTKVHFIPSVKGSFNLASELFFEDARDALQQSLKDALDSVYVIPEGTKKAYAISKDVYRVSGDISHIIRKYTRGEGIWLIDRSSKIAKDHIIGAFDDSKRVAVSVYDAGDRIESFFDVASRDIASSHWKRSKKTFSRSMDAASKINKVSVRLAKEHFNLGTDAFIQGYVTLPSRLGKNLGKMGESFSASRFAQAHDRANEFRKESSVVFKDIISDTFSNYAKETGESLSKVSKNFSKHVQEEGVVLASLKSMRWLLQGIFYDALIKPIAKLTVGTVGLISVNGVIYPVHVVAEEAKESTMVMVEVTAQTAKSLYEIVAPSIHFALASVLGSTEYLGGKVLAGSTATLGTAASGVDATAGLALSGASKTTGFVLGKSTQYIGVPIAVSANAVGKVGYGVLASSGSAALGTTLLATGETAALATDVTGMALSGTTLVGGTGVSVVSASVQGVYNLTKAVVLPTGYTLSSGTVLGYGSLSQLQAHTILAASDAAYMILSLEGPKWVLYSITGKSIKDDKALPAGAIVDLKSMQEHDENIKRIEVSDAEMQKVLLSLDKDLPSFEKEKPENNITIDTKK